MAKETNVEKLCDRELLEKILSIVERQEKLPPPAHEGGHAGRRGPLSAPFPL